MITIIKLSPDIKWKPWGREEIYDHLYFEKGPTLKYIFAREDLSLQNHTEKFESFIPIVSPGFIYTSFEPQTVPASIQKFPIVTGITVDIPPGFIHAIPAESEVLEISWPHWAATNRIWDWPDRRKTDRELHIKDAIKAFKEYEKSKDKPLSAPYELFNIRDGLEHPLVIEPNTKVLVTNPHEMCDTYIVLADRDTAPIKLYLDGKSVYMLESDTTLRIVDVTEWGCVTWQKAKV